MLQCCLLLIIVTTKATFSPTQGTHGHKTLLTQFLLSSQFWVDTASPVSVSSQCHAELNSERLQENYSTRTTYCNCCKIRTYLYDEKHSSDASESRGELTLVTIFLLSHVSCLQTVSCYRSTGAMPVPRPVTMIIPHYLPHRDKPRVKAEQEAEKREELVIKHAEMMEMTEDVREEAVMDSDVIIESCEASISVTESVMERMTRTVTVIQEPEEPEPAPLPEPVKPKKREQTCKKHSRCHCDMLSLETTGFFDLKV